MTILELLAASLCLDSIQLARGLLFRLPCTLTQTHLSSPASVIKLATRPCRRAQSTLITADPWPPAQVKHPHQSIQFSLLFYCSPGVDASQDQRGLLITNLS